MEECTEQAVQAMLPLVSAQRREQALRFNHTHGRFCCLKSWLMLNGLLDEPVREKMDEWQYNEHGKPFILHTPAIHFSISHCKEGIAVAVDEAPIGIDMESIRKADTDLIKRVLCAREQEQVMQAADPNRAFTRLWTRKEAVVKMHGKGIESFEQLQNSLTGLLPALKTVEKENYIYSIVWQG